MTTAASDRRCPWGTHTAVMAILNITPDSFSDGGLHLQPQQACRAARRMATQGADLLDIGAQSTRPGAVDVGPVEELRRLLPVLEQLVSARRDGDLPSGLLLSIDTFLAPVAAAGRRYDGEHHYYGDRNGCDYDGECDDDGDYDYDRDYEYEYCDE